MTVKRVLQWQCDGCDTSVAQARFGLPVGWVYVPGSIGLNGMNRAFHLCGTCSSNTSKKTLLVVKDLEQSAEELAASELIARHPNAKRIDPDEP